MLDKFDCILLNCDNCGKLVAMIKPGSHIKRGAVMICTDCVKPPEFFKAVFGVKK